MAPINAERGVMPGTREARKDHPSQIADALQAIREAESARQQMAGMSYTDPEHHAALRRYVK